MSDVEHEGEEGYDPSEDVEHEGEEEYDPSELAEIVVDWAGDYEGDHFGFLDLDDFGVGQALRRLIYRLEAMGQQALGARVEREHAALEARHRELIEVPADCRHPSSENYQANLLPAKERMDAADRLAEVLRFASGVLESASGVLGEAGMRKDGARTEAASEENVAEESRPKPAKCVEIDARADVCSAQIENDGIRVFRPGKGWRFVRLQERLVKILKQAFLDSDMEHGDVFLSITHPLIAIALDKVRKKPTNRKDVERLRNCVRFSDGKGLFELHHWKSTVPFQRGATWHE